MPTNTPPNNTPCTSRTGPAHRPGAAYLFTSYFPTSMKNVIYVILAILVVHSIILFLLWRAFTDPSSWTVERIMQDGGYLQRAAPEEHSDCVLTVEQHAEAVRLCVDGRIAQRPQVRTGACADPAFASTAPCLTIAAEEAKAAAQRECKKSVGEPSVTLADCDKILMRAGLPAR